MKNGKGKKKKEKKNSSDRKNYVKDSDAKSKKKDYEMAKKDMRTEKKGWKSKETGKGKVPKKGKTALGKKRSNKEGGKDNRIKDPVKKSTKQKVKV